MDIAIHNQLWAEGSPRPEADLQPSSREGGRIE